MKKFLLNFALTLAAGVGLTLTASAQNVVGGSVKGPDGEPVVGAAVIVEDSALGTSTDVNGEFSLNVPNPKSDVLVVNFLGFKELRVPVNGRTRVDIELEEDATTLDDVVVVGYGTVRKRDLTGSVVSVKNDDIVMAPTGNPMEALQGRVTGLDITKSSGQVGSDVDILLRGSRSIYGDNSPLFVIDGFIGSYNQVNPSDIESIDVLKDASSTAIYGSAGANGVIIITTKRGKEGKASVNFDAYYGISGAANYAHGMVGDEWMNYQREAYRFRTGSYPANDEALFGNSAYYNAYTQGKWIDWVDLASGNTAVTQKYNVSVQGGNEKTKAFASASYNNDTGLLRNENRDRYQLRLNLDQEIFKWMRFGFSSNLTYTNHDRDVQGTFSKSLTAFPLGDAYEADGKTFRSEYITGQNTPLGDYIPDQYVYNTRSTYVNSNAFLEILPVDGLSIKTQISGTLSNSRTGRYWGLYSSSNPPSYASAPFAQKDHSDSWGYLWENIFSYNKTFAQDHTIGAQFITSWRYAQTETTAAGASGQQMDRLLFHQLGGGTATYTQSEFAQTQQMSYAVRLNYSYKGKYMVTFSNRWDGVSWLTVGRKWDSFPAGAIAWRISEEGFMADTRHWLDNLKLRVSYGVTGNAGGVGAYNSVTQIYPYNDWGVTIDNEVASFTQYTGTFGGVVGWEKSYNLNVGVDYSFFNGRLDGSIEWFNTKTKGLLYKRNLPITSGLTGWGSPLASWQNLAETSSRGVEFTLNARTIQNKQFQWNTGLTLTWAKERIDDLPDGDIIAESLFVGQPIHAVYGYKYDGIWGTNTSAEDQDAYGVQPGFVRIKTLDKDGDGGVHKYSTDDRMVLGHTNPDWIIGFNNSFYYKNFDLTLYIMARLGNTIYSDMLGRYTATDGMTTNQPSGADYWTENNQGAYYPRPGTGSLQTVMSALNIADGSFVKIKNITLGYTLPKAITRKIKMERLRIYATCYNPVIFAMDKNLSKLHLDPETNGNDVFPTYKQFVFGINISF